MTLVLELSLPVMAMLAILVARVYTNIKYPTPLPLGRILPKLCVVNSREILDYNELLERELQNTHLQTTVRRNQIRINRSYFAQMDLNTRLFQQAARFEKIKIHPGKPGLDYEPREIMVLELVDELAQLRWELTKAQAGLFLRTLAGIRISQDTLKKLLASYKDVEQDIVELAGMSGNSFYHAMLMERLGLANWEIIEGESSAPA